MDLLQLNRSDELSTRLDSEVDINLKLSTKFSLYVIVLLLSSSFLIGTEIVKYFLKDLFSLLVSGMIFFFFHSQLFLLHALFNLYKTFPYSLSLCNNQVCFLLFQMNNL